MSFSAYKNDEKIYSFKMTNDEWELLKKDKENGLKFRCCDSEVVCKQNRKGIRYFEHKSKDECNADIDTCLDSLTVKIAIVELLMSRGWDVETEKNEVRWSADIYAENNNHKMCIQVRMEEPELTYIEKQNKKYEKAGIKALWFVKFSDKYFRYNIGKYNDAANVLGIKKNNSEVRVFGFFEIEENKYGKKLSDVKDLELSEFLQVFFIERRIQRHKLERKTFMMNFDYHDTRCINCHSKSNLITYVNASFDLNGEMVLFGNTWYEDIEDRNIFNNINASARELNMGCKLGLIEQGWDYDEDEPKLAVVQVCMWCGGRSKLKKSARTLENNKVSPYKKTSKPRYTKFGVFFGSVWIINQ